MAHSNKEFPTSAQFCWYTLQALHARGQALSNSEIEHFIAEALSVPDEVRRRPHGSGLRTEFGYRAAWARTVLRMKGLIDIVARSAWRLTPAGAALRSEAECKHVLRRESPPPV